ncbi:GNAT family N-acetyltransferase [Kitasatospora sp. NBC_01287]|uniref:GNAT family N-acetyltransferase n=1 Tax=Kitasatospora sp. NBC_01287 TaxID=2903573 RepID=UPI002255A517|nr:GNAT family N-acetyltransferase [Kitasatospora sp. NBC_01287]MCX4745165.1 GNAT family N-acetyltransferase [Kitasatospora sp. NBC_01287]
MTTTLRPAGPEEAHSDGGRDRRWLVCANGRPVGSVRTGARPHGTHLTGRIAELEIFEGRRRGRGTIAVLAAEEVLRAWGCYRAEVTVPAEAAPAHALALALGYTETNRKLLKRLGRAPAPRADLMVRQIDADAFPDWLAATKAEYRRHLVGSGLTEAQAHELCEADHSQLLTRGHATEGVVLRLLISEGRPVGSLWLALSGARLPDGTPRAWVMTVEVPPEERGSGFGRELMLLAERECLAAGIPALGLNVYTANQVAIGLYDSLGYRITARVLAKAL